MDIFTQKKLLVRIVIALVVMNCFMTGALLWKDFFHRPSPSDNNTEVRDVSRILERELGLTPDQVMEIQKIRDDFSMKEKVIEAKIKSARDSMNSKMFSANTDHEFVKSLAQHVADYEYSMEMLRLEQADAVKAVCTKDQLKKFENLIQELREYLKPGNQKDQENKPGKEARKKRDDRQRRERRAEQK